MTVQLELFTILTSLASLLAAGALLVVASRLKKCYFELERMNLFLGQLRTGVGPVSSVAQHQDETIRIVKDKEEPRDADTLVGQRTS